MTFAKYLIGILSLVFAVAIAGDTRAAPLHSTVKDSKQADTNVHHVQYRLCVNDRGTRRCRTVEIYGGYGPSLYMPPSARGYGYSTYGYGPQYPAGLGAYPFMDYGYLPGSEFTPNSTDSYVNPDYLPTGSPAWWEAMDKLGRGGHRD